MTGILCAIAGSKTASGGGFSPVTNTYTSGTAATETVPTGATQVVITLDGGGGAGGYSGSTIGGGGGGGSRSVKTIAVVGGNTMIYTVGPSRGGRNTGGLGQAGTASTVSGTVSGGSVSMTANGGGGGNSSVGGAGGNATGGDTNTSGTAGFDGTDEGVGGDGASGATGGNYVDFLNMTGPIDGNAPGGGGGGSGFDAGGITSGAGARGQVSFAYT